MHASLFEKAKQVLLSDIAKESMFSASKVCADRYTIKLSNNTHEIYQDNQIILEGYKNPTVTIYNKPTKSIILYEKMNKPETELASTLNIKPWRIKCT